MSFPPAQSLTRSIPRPLDGTSHVAEAREKPLIEPRPWTRNSREAMSHVFCRNCERIVEGRAGFCWHCPACGSAKHELMSLSQVQAMRAME